MNSDKTREDAPMPPKEDQVTTAPEENQINESYWPTLRKILEDDPSGMDRLNLECMMCKLPMSTKAGEHVKDESGHDHKAIILACGHMFGRSCLAQHRAYRAAQDLDFACPLNVCGTSIHPVCGCTFLGSYFPEKVEHLGTCKRTAAEGLKVMPKCPTCVFDDVLQSLTLLASVLDWERFHELESFSVAYRIQFKNDIWGAFEGDERQSAEREIPAPMREHCRNVEVSLATRFSCPSRVFREEDFKIRFFEYSGPLEMSVVRRGLAT